MVNEIMEPISQEVVKQNDLKKPFGLTVFEKFKQEEQATYNVTTPKSVLTRSPGPTTTNRPSGSDRDAGMDIDF